MCPPPRSGQRGETQPKVRVERDKPHASCSLLDGQDGRNVGWAVPDFCELRHAGPGGELRELRSRRREDSQHFFPSGGGCFALGAPADREQFSKQRGTLYVVEHADRQMLALVAESQRSLGAGAVVIGGGPRVFPRSFF